jgi:hypothetical protein
MFNGKLKAENAKLKEKLTEQQIDITDMQKIIDKLRQENLEQKMRLNSVYGKEAQNANKETNTKNAKGSSKKAKS